MGGYLHCYSDDEMFIIRSAFPKRPVCEMGGKDSLGTRACLRLLGWRWGDREAAIALLSLCVLRPKIGKQSICLKIWVKAHYIYPPW